MNEASPTYTEDVKMAVLLQDLEELKKLILFRLKKAFHKEEPDPTENPLPHFAHPVAHHSPYDDFLLQFRPNDTEKIILLLALIPHLRANFFESLILQFLPQGGDLPEIGGAKGNHHRGMMPTGETAAFILNDDLVGIRKQLSFIFSKDHFFSKENILYLETIDRGEPKLSGRILLSEEYANYFITGNFGRPEFNPDFPAKMITTKMSWDDLVLHPFTAEQINDIKRWMQYHHVLEADPNLSRKLMTGFRILFYGPSGTGKTLTATLLGKEFQREVYRIDLSQIVSKYIGETEKNLDKIFERARNKDWILFFDEADALFGKRTSVQSAHDKYANQETAFLLQRIEDFPGLIILASNFKSNIDEAFLRRFHSIVHFPMPNAKERLKLWEKSLPEMIAYDKGTLQLPKLAANYEISGAAIINVMQYACLAALPEEDKRLSHDDLVEGIRREMRKEER